MKRRLPTTRKGEIVLAAISLPPLTDDANRHAPTASHPGKARGRVERRRDRGQREPARLSGRADRLAAQLDRQRRERHPELRGAGPEPAHPARARSYTARPPAPPPGAPRTRRRPPARSPRRPSRPRPAARPARTPAAARGSPGTARTAPWARTSSGSGPPPGHAASSQTRTPAARRTTGRPDGGPPPSGQPPHTHRPAAGTAIRWPRATHRLGSLPAIGVKRGEEGSLTFSRDSKILARTAATRRRHRQRARPDTRPRCSGNQAVNSGL